MAGTPAYPPDWATELHGIRRSLTSLAGQAQTRIGYTGGALPGALSVGQQLTAAGGLDVTGEAEISGALAAGSVAATGAVSAGSATITGTVTADEIAADALTLDGTAVDPDVLALLLDPPGATLVKGADQAIPSAAQTAVTGMTYTVGAGEAGYYAVAGAIRWENSPDGRRQANIDGDGGLYQCSSVHSGRNTLLVTPIAHQRLALDVGDQVYPSVYQDSGGGLDVLATSWMSVRWVGPL